MKKYLFRIFFFFPLFVFSQTPLDILLINGRIIDGSGAAVFSGDIGISGGKIVAIGDLKNRSAKRTIDVSGEVIAPGFIDIHTHIEGDEAKTPTADNFIHDGVTTVITGNCGSSETDVARYLNRLVDLKLSVNVGTFIGQGSVRTAVMGGRTGKPSVTELSRMEKMVDNGMNAGAFGLSTGLIYVPGTYSSTAELVALAKVAARHGGIYTTHMRSETGEVFEAIKESIDIGRQAKLPVEISHLKVGRPNWGGSTKALKLIADARAVGLDVTCDQYPYAASSTSLFAIIPVWARGGTDSSFAKRLEDPVARKKIVSEMLNDAAKRGNADFEYAVVASSSANSSLNGKSIRQINAARGGRADLTSEINTILDLAATGSVQMVYHGLKEEDVETILKSPGTMVISDGSIRVFGSGVPHPRSYGSNARVLAHYVRERKLITLEDAVSRMTGLPAKRLKLKNKGLLKVGMDADVTVFNPETVQDQSVYDHPHAYSTGFDYVLVNGVLTLDQGNHTKARAGKELRMTN